MAKLFKRISHVSLKEDDELSELPKAMHKPSTMFGFHDKHADEVSKSKQTTVNELKILELIAVEIVESVQDLEESDVYSNGCYEDDDALKAQFHHVFDAAVARLTRIRDAHYDAERAKHLASPDGIPNIVKETIKALGTVQTGRNSLRQKIRKRQYGKHMELLVRADRVLMEAERTDRELKELRGEKAAMKGELQRLSEKNEQLLARLDEHAKKTVRVDELLKGVELLCKQPPIKHNRRVTQSAEYSKVSDWVVVSPIPERAAKETVELKPNLKRPASVPQHLKPTH